MNLKQALKQKNRLVGLINEEYKKASQYNSIEKGYTRPYSAKEAIDNWRNLTEQLITLKCKIQIANQPVYDKIFRLAELKTQARQMKELTCVTGTHTSRWPDEKSVIKFAEIGIVERDQMVTNIETQIENLQDELDTWNHETLIN